MRPILVTALTVLSCVLIVLATVALGIQQTLLDTERWVAVVGPLASQPRVQSSIAETAASVTSTAVDAQIQSLPGPLRSLATPIEASATAFVENTTQQLVASPQFAQAWVDGNRTIHQQLVDLLRGDPLASNAVKVDNGQVEVNVLMLAPALLPGLQQQVPAAILSLLPGDFGYVAIAQASTLATLQRFVQVLDRLTLGLVVAAPLVTLLTLGISMQRRRTAMWLGIGVAVGLLIAAATLLLAFNAAAGSFDARPIRGAVQASLDAMLLSMDAGMLVVFVIAVAVALVAGLTGRRAVGRESHEVVKYSV